MNAFTAFTRNVCLGLAVTAFAAGAATASTPVAAPVAVTSTAVKVSQSRDGYNRRVTIHNQTGWTMLRFYASDHRASDWEEDILGSDTLASGRSWTVNIDDGSGACVYDFKAEFTNGQELTRMSINVCQIADYYYTR